MYETYVKTVMDQTFPRPLDHERAGSGLRGFYLHACWKFNHPFAVRSWSQEDFGGMFALLREMGFNLVMLWPPFECIPAPIGTAERGQLLFYRDLVDRAHAKKLECWVVATANCTVRPEIAEIPLAERHYYPFRVDVRLDDPGGREAYLSHRREMQKILNNADAYVTIDGDPGGYPGAAPRDFVDVLLADRRTIDDFGTHPESQKIVPWLWCGWGADWGKNGTWQEPIEPLNGPLLEEIKHRIFGPWNLLPGRSCWEHWANGRTNMALAERAGVIPESVLLTYEVIEFEPTPPGIRIQFEHIRRVFREEKDLLALAKGVMGNAQQPVMALPNLYFFGRSASDSAYLERGDRDVLCDLAGFLGGDPEVLVPAWDCLRLGLAEIPDDLPEKLASAALNSPAASLIPGGAPFYLRILAAFVRARVEILRLCEGPSAGEDLPSVIAGCLRQAYQWWLMHRYVYSGERGDGFRLEYVEAGLLAPLARLAGPDAVTAIAEGVHLFAQGGVPEGDCRSLAEDLEALFLASCGNRAQVSGT